MNKSMAEFLKAREKQGFATGRGTEIHRQLQFLKLDSEYGGAGLTQTGKKSDLGTRSPHLQEKIRENLKLAQFWGTDTRPEVPIAGYLNGKFVSRRIDRLKITLEAVEFLDYKTDADKTIRRDKYAAQMKEYATLLRMAYPNRTIRGYILWTHDWELEKIIKSD